MSAILPQAQSLISKLQTLMPSVYQQDSLQALLGLFLQGQGFPPLPEHCQTKSASALSRFLNEYKWSTRQVLPGSATGGAWADFVPTTIRTETDTASDTRSNNPREGG